MMILTPIAADTKNAFQFVNKSPRNLNEFPKLTESNKPNKEHRGINTKKVQANEDEDLKNTISLDLNVPPALCPF